MFCCDDIGATAYVFQALSHPSRLRLIRRLADGPHSKRALQAELPTGDAYEHLKVLHAAGIVYPTGIGRNIQWSLTPDVLTDIAELLTASTDSTLHPNSPRV